MIIKNKMKKLFAILTIAAVTSIAVAQQQPAKTTATKAKVEKKDDKCKQGKDCCKAPSRAASMMAAPKPATKK